MGLELVEMFEIGVDARQPALVSSTSGADPDPWQQSGCNNSSTLTEGAERRATFA